MMFNDLRSQLNILRENNYEDFTKALISIELGEDDEEVLNDVLNAFEDFKWQSILSDNIIQSVRKYSSVSAKLEKLAIDESVSISEMLNIACDKELGNIENIHDIFTMERFLNDKVSEGVDVSHISEVLESNNAELYHMWLGNSSEIPRPIASKLELLYALL